MNAPERIARGAADARDATQRLLDDARRRLVDTGTRNRLIHVNRANIRGPVLSIVDERADDVHALLANGRSLRFRAGGRDGEEAAGVALAAPADATPPNEDRFTDAWLETRLGPDALAKKLLAIARDARTAEEEQGVNILFLAVGFATWFEDDASTVAREAPLLLLPVELKRDQRTSTHLLRLREEDLETNLPLQKRWQDDFGIKLPEVDASADGWVPSAYLAEVEAAIAVKPRWRVDRDAMQLGFFSFAKLLMHRDLALKAWPDGALADHPLARGLLHEGFAAEPPIFAPGARLDDALPPEALTHVVDADASQARVIEEARRGRSLVVQGPPGTGKSQTITNIIAAAVAAGETVLFVAEKMAALSVVHDRLVKAGLRDVALELHSRAANKRAVLAELARTLAAGAAVPAMPPPPDALRQVRDRLNAAAAALHAPIGDTGDTPYGVLGRQARLLGAGAPAPTLDVPGLETMTRAQEAALLALLAAYGERLEAAGPASTHPLAGVGALDLDPVALARLAEALPRAADAADALRAALEASMEAVGLAAARAAAMAGPLLNLLERLAGLATQDAPLATALIGRADLPLLADALTAAAAWRQAADAAEPRFTPAAFAADADAIRGAFAAGAASWWARWGGSYRAASRTLAGWLRGPLPKRAADRLDLLDQLAAVQAARRRWTDDEPLLASALGTAWRGERTDFVRAAAVARWCAAARAAAADGAPDIAPDRLTAIAAAPRELAAMMTSLRAALAAAPLIDAPLAMLAHDQAGGAWRVADASAVATLLRAVAGALDRYGEWAALARARARLADAGLGDLAARIDAGMTAAAAADELRLARAERLWARACAADPALRSLRDLDRHGLAAEFARLERERFGDNARAVLARHLDQLPQGAQGEMKVLRGEIAKKRAHMPLRKLFRAAPQAIQRIKPVLLMSPVSVAQFLPPGALTFDLLLIDEASQVRPEEALGAIARARSIVVVGDQKQLPPTNFFSRLGEEADDRDEDEGAPADDPLGGAASVGDAESILTLCEARGLPRRMLSWHYRSRDPSLMRVSNAEFYDDELILPPSPLERDPAYGLAFTRVAGAYDRGGRRDNRLEGEAVVRAAQRHARDTPDMSLGIVTFSQAQKVLLTELLEAARRVDPALDALLREGKREDVFVKNIENVQGDERDVILISVGYGPSTPGGRMTGASFGPVNGDGGERRLNVLFTRARLRCEVFASFDPSDLDVSGAKHAGPRVLKRFLDFAKSDRLHMAAPTGREADSPFEEDVADAIRGMGFLADPQVGSAGFRIDIGVRHPDRPGDYLLAVECDGAAYHSALWARERDRMRQEVLERLGWSVHRIWSTDWFHDRRGQTERLRARLAEAWERAQAGARIVVDGANGAAADRIAQPAQPSGCDPLPSPLPATSASPPYVRAELRGPPGLEPHSAPMSVLAPLARRVVEAEGPVHVEEVARRIAAAFGKKGAGSRIVAAVGNALAAAGRGGTDLRRDGDFWMTAAQAADPLVRDRSGAGTQTFDIAMVSPQEIRAALTLAERNSPGCAKDDLVRAAARLLGFRRVGPDVAARVGAAAKTA